MEDIRERLETWGIERVILGTAAVVQPKLVKDACALYNGKIACGIDAKNGQVALRGWVDVSGVSAADLAKRMEESGAAAIIYTDIAKDGMLSGPNVIASRTLAGYVSIPVIASGGIAALQDLTAVKEAGCAGAVVGKALYSGAFTLPEALQLEC
jgi:phosphoribosylformimino-5-aminoimidazole carboxamide ribotide isomerase